MSRKKLLKLRAGIHTVAREGVKQPAIEAAELLLMMETLFRWVTYDHRHKTYLSRELITVAARVMELRSVDNTHWELCKTWGLIAFGMGLDTKSFKIIDETRFKWFWWQIGQTGKFDLKLQRRLIESKKEPPEIEPLILRAEYPGPKIKSERQHAEAVTEYQNNSRKQDIMEHFFV